MQIKKIASFDVKNGASTVRYADLDDGISFFPTDGIINIKSNKVRIAGFGVDANSLYRIDSSGAMYPLGNSNSVFLSNEGLLSSASIGGSSGNNKWILAISDDFGVTDGGTLYAKNANIDGTIQSSKGRIGGWDIGGDHLQNGGGNDFVYVGNGTNGSGDFLVVRSGGAYNFWVHKDGTMYCNKATISGNITAREGQIASYTISGDYLMSTDQQVGLSAGYTSFWAGYNTGDGSYKFKVTKDGALTATNANITGTINADKGKIAGFQIDESLSGYPLRMRSRLVSYDDKSLISMFTSGGGGLTLSAYRAEVSIGNDTGIFTSNRTTHSGASNTFLSGWDGSHWGLSCTTDLYLTSTGTDKKVYTVNGPSSTSDRKAKNIIRDSLDAYDFIMHLKPIKFTWKKGKKVHMGFIAQDVYDYLHTQGYDNYDIVNATHNNDNVDNVQDYDDKDLDWHMSYNDVIAPLVETVQRLSKEVERLKGREQK